LIVSFSLSGCGARNDVMLSMLTIYMDGIWMF
jgi:hypothetical protein